MLLLFVRFALKMGGWQRTRAWVKKHSVKRQLETPRDPEQIATTTCERVAAIAVFFPGRALCLEQSLVLWLTLVRRGLPVQLRFGLIPYKVRGHAWVVCNGTPIGEVPERLERFSLVPETWS